MKKAKSGLWMPGLLLVLGLVFTGCQNPSGGGNGGGSNPNDAPPVTTGSVTIKNNSNTFRIGFVDIYDVVTDQSVKIDDEGVDKGKSKTYSGIEPNDKLKVYIEDGTSDSYSSVQFSLKAGDTKTFTYDGFGLK
jgi:hypothetical protein